MTNSFLVVTGVDFPSEYDADYLKYVRIDHIPQLLAIPGISCARCFRLVQPDKALYADGTLPRHIILIETTNSDVTESKEFKSLSPWQPKTSVNQKSPYTYEYVFGLRHTEYTGMSNKYLRLIRQDKLPEVDNDLYERLYNTAHIPPLIARSGVNAVKRYRLVKGEGQKYAAFYEMESLEVFERWILDRPIRRETEWDIKISPKIKNISGNVYEQLYGLALY